MNHDCSNRHCDRVTVAPGLCLECAIIWADTLARAREHYPEFTTKKEEVSNSQAAWR